MHIAFLGCGNMGRAIIGGLLRSNGTTVSITAYDKSAAATAALPSSVRRLEPREWFSLPDAPQVVVVAVKPADVSTALAPLAALNPAPDVLWISIAAGVSIDGLARLLGNDARICRVMPNTPALINEGVSAYALSPLCRPDDGTIVESILSSCGSTVRVSEKMLNAVTGLSGSGPAYVFLFIESLIEAGVTAGLPQDVARRLAVQTVIGSARMLEQSDESAGQQKMKVMSPGGTTAAGLAELERCAFKSGVIQAVVAAKRRADELGS